MLQNRYRVVSSLGKGGMGAVYRAWDTRLDVPVALKEMVPQPGLDEDTLSQLRYQFEREAKTLARLSHPHLVRVTDYYQEGGNAYLVMEFVEGESLEKRIEREGALPEGQVLTWAEQLADAVAYCHSQGVIHRDIKPHNVVICPDGRAMLVDFGLVKLWDPNDPQTRTVMRGMGTPEYAPPEQYGTRPGHTDQRSDLYGLGATLYHALTGQAPMTANDRMAFPSRFLPVRSLNPQVSERTGTAVSRAMALSVEERFATVQEMSAALRGDMLTTGSLVRSRRSTKTMSGARVARARSVPLWLLWGAVALAVLGVGGGAVAVVLGTGAFTLAEPPPTATVPPTATATLAPSATPAPTATSAVRTSTPLPTSTPTPEPVATDTPVPPTATPKPTVGATRAPAAVSPELTSPQQGSETGNPITFEWSGSLGGGQSYQVTARHIGTDYVIQSELLTGQSWAADLPAENFGEWRWTVSVVRSGEAAAISAEGMFWFNPHVGPGGGGGGGGGGGEVQPTAAPVNP
jgi:serine/threonine-protein kinase